MPEFRKQLVRELMQVSGASPEEVEAMMSHMALRETHPKEYEALEKFQSRLSNFSKDDQAEIWEKVIQNAVERKKIKNSEQAVPPLKLWTSTEQERRVQPKGRKPDSPDR